VFEFPNICDILAPEKDYEKLKLDEPIYVLIKPGHYDALFLDDKANNEQFKKEEKFGLKNLAMFVI